MKQIIALCFFLGSGASIAWGQRPPSRTVATAVISRQPALEPANASITFLTAANGAPAQDLGAGQGLLNLGSVSYFSRSSGNDEMQTQKSSFSVSTRFGVRIGDVNQHRAGTVNVSAALINPNTLRTVRVDGVRLSIVPQIIARRISYGAVTEHVLQVTIPTSDPARPFSDVISVVARLN
jgi:hypothetical protein